MIERIYDDWHVAYKTQANGWVNTTCPYCGDTGEHLGCGPDFLFFNCWRCGAHPVKETLSKLLHIPESKVPEVLRKYDAPGGAARVRPEPRVSINPFKYPTGTGPLNKYHKHYLRKRGYDPEALAFQWGLQGTGPMSRLDGINYGNRVLIPIRWRGEDVSFQARDISGKSDLKYIACPKARERKEHQTVLYGDQTHWASSRTGIIVEGVTDVWRMGPSSAAVFGIDFKLEQVMEIAAHFDRIFILFDAERQAQRMARKLEVKLAMLGKEVHREVLEGGGDPGDLKQNDADHLARQLLTKIF